MFRQHIFVQTVVDIIPASLGDHETRISEDAKMLGDRSLSDLQVSRKRTDAQDPSLEQFDYTHPRGDRQDLADQCNSFG